MRFASRETADSKAAESRHGTLGFDVRNNSAGTHFRGAMRPASTLKISAPAPISANAAGSAPVIHT